MVARGPYGIRTWFYNRRGTGGWERYLPDGYPDFPGAPTTTGQQPTGEAAAFQDLTVWAKENNVIPQSVNSVRDVWASENAPQRADVDRLQGDLVTIGNCSGLRAGEPPSYQTCTKPSMFDGFTDADWTAVINEMLAENYAASQVLGFFNDLHGMRDDLFLQESAELPGIGDDLGLPAAAGNTAQFNALPLVSGGLGIAASLAGLIPGIGPVASAALWVGAEVASMIPQTSPTVTGSSFPSTYAGLAAKFAQMVSETEKGMAVMSQEVRQDASLLNLVGQLRASGPWATNNLDTIGLESAANQGFAIWVYQALMPTVYDRYDIQGCRNYTNYHPAGSDDSDLIWELDCTSAPDAAGVQYGDSQTFISIGQQLAGSGGYPCFNVYAKWVCAYDRVPSNANMVWGALSDNCSYQPGHSETAWTFGECSAGVDVRTSVGLNTWGFPSHSGSPDPPEAWCGTQFRQISKCSARAALASSRARTAQEHTGRQPIRLDRPGSGRRRAVRGRAQIRADIGSLRGVRLAGATVRVKRLLFELGHRELTAPKARRGPQPLKLRLVRAGGGRFVAASKGRRPVRLVLRRRGPGASLRLTSERVYHTPRACHALPASVALQSPPLWLHTRLVISDGRHRTGINLRHHVRCMRDARGNVDRLEYVRYRRYQARGGLAVTLRGPRSVRPGATVTYVARVHNRRRHSHRLVSSLWDITLTTGTRTKHIPELRRGRSRTLVFTVRVPRSAPVSVPRAPRGRFCIEATAGAPGVRADRARACSRVRAAARAPASRG